MPSTLFRLLRNATPPSRLPLVATSLAWALACTAIGSVGAGAETAPARYRVVLDRPQTQTVGVTVELSDVDEQELDLELPVWRPGRYSVLDPAGTVRDVRAEDGAGRSLEVRKVDKTTWRVTTQGSPELRFSYRLYANELGLRTRHVDDSHAFLSGSTVFVYNAERRDHPVRITIDAPDEWQIASGLESAPEDPRTLVAPDYDVLVDSPIEIGLHDRHEFEVEGRRHEIVIWPPGRRYDAERLHRDFAAIVAEQKALFGGFPYSRYVFLLHVGRGAGGGTEHLNSTIMQVPLDRLEASLDPEDSEDYRRLLGLVSHEMFHTWNVKQLRPAGIAPYDWRRENYSTLYWVAEGTTSYYDDLTLLRTGLVDEGQYLKGLSETIDDHRRRPGSRVQSLSQSSFDAWVTFNRRTPDDVNSTVSFYSKGALVSLLLDLEIRRRSDGSASLDDVLRTMYERFPLGEGGYTREQLQAVIEETASGSFDAFFRDFVDGVEPLPLEDALAGIGLELRLEPKKRNGGNDGEGSGEDADEKPVAERPDLGLELRDEGGRTLVAAVLADGPAWLAGVSAGDEVVALDRVRLRASELEERLRRRRVGEEVVLHLLRHDDLLERRIVLAAEPDAEWKIGLVDEPSDEQRRAWEAWSGRPWPEEKGGDHPSAAPETPAAKETDDQGNASA